MTRSIRLLALAALLVLVSTVAPALGQDWTQYRGSDTGRVELPTEEFGLDITWKRDLGSGYSDVSIAGGVGVTMFTAGDSDVVTAFEVATGDELWRYDLGEKYAGHNGSTDGPLSTPAIAGNSVHVLGPRGQLVALDLKDGSELWTRTLDETSSTVPFYGYTSSPVVADDVVIVATGGEGHSVSAYDRSTGKDRWTTGDDSVTYQTPILLGLDGRPQLVAVTDRYVQGLDPDSGDVLWRHQHTEGDQTETSAHAIPIGDDRFVVNYNRGAKAYRISGGEVEQIWESNAFGNSLAIPVVANNHLFGFTGRFLTCASAETGEIVWRSRPPGGLGIARIGNLLAITNPDGDLVLIDPTPEGYREVTRTAVLDAGDYPAPSYHDGTFLVRNLVQLAAVSIDTAAVPQTAKVDDSDRLMGAFGEWIASVEALEESSRQAAVDERLADQEGPVLDPSGLVHFVWRGDAEDIGVSGDPVPQGRELGLYRLAGTDLFYRGLELDPAGQYTYNLTVDYGQPAPDPTNPLTVDQGFAVFSELRLPGWPESPHLAEPAEDAPRGTLDTFQFHSEVLDNTREVRVWRPATYGGDPEARFPVLVVNHGDNLLRGGLMQNSLDNLVGSSVAPLIAVFVPRAAQPEYGGPQGDDYTQFLVEELLPHVDRHYRTDGENRAIMGPGSAGVAAVQAALQHPEVFKRAAAQSFYPISPSDEGIPELIAADGPKPEQVHLIWSPRDYDLGNGVIAEDASKELRDQLEAAGIAVSHGISNYSPGWGGWRGQHDEILELFFPMEASDEAGP